MYSSLYTHIRNKSEVDKRLQRNENTRTCPVPCTPSSVSEQGFLPAKGAASRRAPSRRLHGTLASGPLSFLSETLRDTGCWGRGGTGTAEERQHRRAFWCPSSSPDQAASLRFPLRIKHRHPASQLSRCHHLGGEGSKPNRSRPPGLWRQHWPAPGLWSPGSQQGLPGHRASVHAALPWSCGCQLWPWAACSEAEGWGPLGHSVCRDSRWVWWGLGYTLLRPWTQQLFDMGWKD